MKTLGHGSTWPALGPQSLTRAGQRGYSLGSMVHTPLYPRYLEAHTAAGRTRADFRLLSGPLAVHVADTTEQAWDEAERGLHWWVEFYRRRGMQMPLAPVGELRHDPKAAIYGVPFAAHPTRCSRSCGPTRTCPWTRWRSSSTIPAWIPGRSPRACACSPPS